MDVTFTKQPGRRYTMTVRRERGPILAPRQGPGYDDFLPHDLVHFVVERELGLSGGVFGRLAAGRNNLFWPADPREAARQRREGKRRTSPAEHADMDRSERVASVCQPLWEQRAGRRATPPDWFGSADWDRLAAVGVDRDRLDGILDRLDDVASRWHALPVGGSLTLARSQGAGDEMSGIRVRLVLESGGGNTAGFVVPDEVVEALGGGRRPKVVVTVGPHTWRSSIASMGGRFLLGVSQANRAAAGVAAGQTLDVDLELDVAERTVAVPDDLAAALAGEPAAASAWEAWSYTRRKEAARLLTDAKQEATRQRRLAKLLDELRG